MIIFTTETLGLSYHMLITYAICCSAQPSPAQGRVRSDGYQCSVGQRKWNIIRVRSDGYQCSVGQRKWNIIRVRSDGYQFSVEQRKWNIIFSASIAIKTPQNIMPHGSLSRLQYWSFVKMKISDLEWDRSLSLSQWTVLSLSLSMDRSLSLSVNRSPPLSQWTDISLSLSLTAQFLGLKLVTIPAQGR